ncbi:MAG: replicative DNA helicase [Anaeroplasma sp.]
MNTPIIPCEIDAEIAVIGCIFLDQNIIYKVSDILSPEQFYDIKNKLIYSTMLDLSKKGQGIDVTTVISQLTTKNILEQCGGYEYISEIAEKVYSTANIESYAEMIESAALRRKAINTLNDLAQAGYDGNVSAFDYLEYVEKNVFDISKSRRVESFKHISSVSKAVLENAERNATRTDDVIGLDTGFPSLNKITQGFQEGQLIILAARPAMGKSAMALNLATNVCHRNKNGAATVAVFSLEMSAEQLVERMVASDSSIRLNQIKNGNLSKNEWVRFNTSCAKLSQINLYFDDSSDSTIAKIRAKCRKLKADSNLDFVVIDYLQLIESDVATQRASQLEKITKITRSLKLMARELSIPVLALSQLSRDVEKRDDKHPIMADLRDSGSIEQDADIVMFLYRDDYYNKSSERKGEADLIVAKNRSGSTSEGLPFAFAGEYQRFKEKKDED